MKYKKVILIVILIIAAMLRFYKLGTYPALNADEAALGYNAYSLLETGKDEHGNPWPIHFQSFNDYKPGLYVYLAMPFVAVFGLDVFWVRFPGALLSVGTVFAIYLLVKMILHSRGKTNKLKPKHTEVMALLSAVLLAINPWHIHFSRGAWEVSVATFFMTAGVYFFLRWLNPSQPPLETVRSRNSPPFEEPVSSLSREGVRGGLFSLVVDRHAYPLLFSVTFFVLSLYTYHSARLIAPLLGLGLLFVFPKPIKTGIKKFTVAIIFGLIISLPLLFDLTQGAILSRVSGVGLFADTGPVSRVNEQRGEHKDIDSFSSEILHNKLVNYGLAFSDNWAEHYHGEFLFLSGDDIERNKVPETGQMYLFDILLIPLGIAFIIRRKLKNGVFVLWWLAIAPIAAALTFQSPHALRSQNMVIPLVILSAFGLYYLIGFVRSRSTKNMYVLCSMLFVLVISWNFARYQHMYWVHMAKEYPFSSQYGVEQLIDFVRERKEEDQRVVITDRYDQPYILFLFYLNYPPERFQGEHVLTERDQFGFSTVSNFGNYHFSSIDFEEARKQYSNAIIAGTEEEIPRETNIIKEIYGTNEYKYFDVVGN